MESKINYLRENYKSTKNYCVVECDNKLYYCNIIKENPWPEKKGIFLLEFNEELLPELQKLEDFFRNPHRRMWFKEEDILFE